MRRNELVYTVSQKTGLSEKTVDRVLASILETVVHTVADGSDVQLFGFGTFCQKKRAGRVGRDINRNKPVLIEPMLVPAFHAGKRFKKAVCDKAE